MENVKFEKQVADFMYKKGDYIRFRISDGTTACGVVMWENTDKTIQISDGGNFRGQNWVIKEEDIIQKEISPFLVNGVVDGSDWKQ